MTTNGKNSPAEQPQKVSSAGTHVTETVTSSLIDAQLGFVNAMNQCALAWITLPMTLAEAVYSPTETVAKPAENQTTSAASGRPTSGKAVSGGAASVLSPNATFPKAAALSSSAWITAPMIDGIEETFNDQAFQPRPRETPQRDVLTLWARSNEFGADSPPASERHAA